MCESILSLQHFFHTCLKLLHSTLYIYIYIRYIDILHYSLHICMSVCLWVCACVSVCASVRVVCAGMCLRACMCVLCVVDVLCVCLVCMWSSRVSSPRRVMLVTPATAPALHLVHITLCNCCHTHTHTHTH